MNNNDPIAYNVPTCCICLKPIFIKILLKWKDDTYEQILLLNGISISKNCICQGHTSDSKKKIEIPRAFYDAFDEEAQ